MRELSRLGPHPKERRHYWGLRSDHREAFLIDLQTELKASGESSRVGLSWDNWDLAVDTDPLVDGRIHTAPEHYDQALCVALMVRSTTPVRWTFYVLAAIAAWASLRGAAYAASWIAPLAIVVAVLYHKALVRRATWHAIEAVAAEQGMTVIARQVK